MQSEMTCRRLPQSVPMQIEWYPKVLDLPRFVKLGHGDRQAHQTLDRVYEEPTSAYIRCTTRR